MPLNLQNPNQTKSLEHVSPAVLKDTHLTHSNGLFILLTGISNGSATQKILNGFYKAKHPTNILPSNCTLELLSQRNKNLYLHKNTCINVYNTYS